MVSLVTPNNEHDKNCKVCCATCFVKPISCNDYQGCLTNALVSNYKQRNERWMTLASSLGLCQLKAGHLPLRKACCKTPLDVTIWHWCEHYMLKGNTWSVLVARCCLLQGGLKVYNGENNGHNESMDMKQQLFMYYASWAHYHISHILACNPLNYFGVFSLICCLFQHWYTLRTTSTVEWKHPNSSYPSKGKAVPIPQWAG